ncbi:MAG: hypothetical protein HY042_04720 [Spirochaetia bacterium]|nr:hypothetical protein [Spirochaetia bacterium]
MADKVRDFQSKFMKNLEGGSGEQIAAAIAYVPLFGWVYPYRMKKDDELCQFHGRQGMRLNALVFGIYFVIWLIENFPLTGWLFGKGAWFHPISTGIWTIIASAYLIASIAGAWKAFSGEMWEIPLLDDVIQKLEGLIKEQVDKVKKD